MKRAYRNLIAKTLLINTKSDKAFRGVLWSETGAYVVLRNAYLIVGDEQRIDGELLIERANIDFIQILTTEG